MFSYDAADTSVYDYVHYLTQIAAQPRSEQPNERQSPRREFRCLQQIAPYQNGKLPNKDQLVPVHCLDLASGGLSFISTEPLEDRSLVVALGMPPRVSYVSAEVVHQTPVQIVGCRFTGKVEL